VQERITVSETGGIPDYIFAELFSVAVNQLAGKYDQTVKTGRKARVKQLCQRVGEGVGIFTVDDARFGGV